LPSPGAARDVVGEIIGGLLSLNVKCKAMKWIRKRREGCIIRNQENLVCGDVLEDKRDSTDCSEKLE